MSCRQKLQCVNADPCFAPLAWWCRPHPLGSGLVVGSYGRLRAGSSWGQRQRVKPTPAIKVAARAGHPFCPMPPYSISQRIRPRLQLWRLVPRLAREAGWRHLSGLAHFLQ